LSKSFSGSVHTPPQHDMALQTWPQAPQLEGSVDVSRQAPSQQVSPALHALPQPPQLSGSVATWVHASLQRICPPSQCAW
jgi:hypothetical protein